MKANLAIRRELHARERSFCAGAEVFLHACETDAVTLAWIRRFIGSLLAGAVSPQGVDACFLQDVVNTYRASRHGALCVLHAGAQGILFAELDRILAKL